jgi:tripartite-type tricarboxylate transporter receptor subunit TctC
MMEDCMANLSTAGLVLLTLCATLAPGLAQEYPARPVRFVVPFQPGGLSDASIRQIAPYLSESLRQQVVIENKAGNNSILGTEEVARSAPDGYTLLVVSNTQAAIESLFLKKTYGLERSFAPIASLNHADLVMLVARSLPVNTVAEFVDLAQSKPKALTYASSGIGSPFHMAGELFKIKTGTDIVHVPYRSLNSAREDLLAGQLHMMFDVVLPLVIDQIHSGRVRALGTTGNERSVLLPEVPTLAEAGVPNYQAILWTGVVAPRGTPVGVIDRLNAEINRVITRPDVKEAWSKQGATPLRMSSGQFAEFMLADIFRWGNVVATSGVRTD